MAVLAIAAPASAHNGEGGACGRQIDAEWVQCRHHADGHHQWRQGRGTEGHTWTAYRREARQVRAYLEAIARRRAHDRMASCSRDPHCAVKLASFLTGAPYRLVHRIVGCESGYDPSASNPASSAGGLFQYLSGTWSGVAPSYGMGGRSRYEVWPAAWVGANHIDDGGPGPWAASQHCWG